MKKEILELLKNGKAMSMIEISDALSLARDSDELLAQALTELVNSYDLSLTNKNKYMLFGLNEKNKNVVKGKFIETKGEYGFVRVDGMSEDIFIHGTNSNGAINGDTVLVYLTKGSNRDKKAEGQVIKILDRENNNRVGEVYHYDKKTMVQLDDKKIKKLIYLQDSPEVRRLVDGDKIVVSLTDGKADKDYVKANFVKRIGHVNDPNIDILSIIYEHDINIDFPEECLRELESIPTEVHEKDLVDRRDLRDKMIFTIDGDDTKDIDDAISVEVLKNGNYKLGVHIADVSYYIKENSALDLEARKRGTSVYLVDRVIPMYPHQLSNGICSLNPDVDRLTISCEMEIDNNGKLVDYEVFPSVIHSRIQMTYNKVNEILEKDTVPKGYEEFSKTLLLMNKLAHIIRAERNKRGSIDFDVDEAKVIVDENGVPLDVTLRDRGEGERLIEDFMVRANETVASHFFYMDLPSLYRIHGEPDEERIRKFLKILSSLGISITGDMKKMNPKVIQQIVNELKKDYRFRVLATKLLSCMDKAIYSPENIGHFGLASIIYTHFTSPIRRYPDTTVHRLLHSYFFSKDGITEDKINHFREILSEIALHSSETERNSDECERDVEEEKMAQYMEGFINREYQGMISGFTNIGMFVQLDNMIEGMIPYDSFDTNYYYDNELETVKIGNQLFMLGDELIVKVTRADKNNSEIDFMLVRGVENSEKEKKR